MSEATGTPIDCGSGMQIRMEPQCPDLPVDDAATGVIEMSDGTYICEVAQCQDESASEHIDRCRAIAFMLVKGCAWMRPRPKLRPIRLAVSDDPA